MKEAIRVIVLCAITFLIMYFYLGVIKLNPRYYDIIVDYIYRITNPFY